jgi:hypothetical protein
VSDLTEELEQLPEPLRAARALRHLPITDLDRADQLAQERTA